MELLSPNVYLSLFPAYGGSYTTFHSELCTLWYDAVFARTFHECVYVDLYGNVVHVCVCMSQHSGECVCLQPTGLFATLLRERISEKFITGVRQGPALITLHLFRLRICTSAKVENGEFVAAVIFHANAN